MTVNHAREGIKYPIHPEEYLGRAHEPPFSICEVHRRLWRMADAMTDKDQAAKFKALIEIGYDMGKRMDMELYRYKKPK